MLYRLAYSLASGVRKVNPAILREEDLSSEINFFLESIVYLFNLKLHLAVRRRFEIACGRLVNCLKQFKIQNLREL